MASPGTCRQELCSPPVWLAPSLLVKEEEKQKLLQRGSELQSEHRQMEARDRRLASAVKVHGLEGRRVLSLETVRMAVLVSGGPGMLRMSADDAAVLPVPI